MTEERYAATLVGCGIGDTLGMPVEGWKREQIQRYVGRITNFLDPVIPTDANGKIIEQDEFGKLKCYSEDLQKGECTDDTNLAAALAESIIAQQKLDLADIARRQLQEYVSQKQSDGHIRGGFGKTTMDGFENLLRGISPTESGVIGGPGNAPAMKMPPVGLYMDSSRRYEEGLAFAEKIGAITHQDPRSLAGGIVQAHAIYNLLQDVSKKDFIDSIVDVCRQYEKPPTPEFHLAERGTLLQRLQWIQNNRDVFPDEAHGYLRSNSLVFSSQPFALFMFQKYWDEPIEGLIETVNYGGDCDTTGAMFGALCGAKNGMVFPAHLVEGLHDAQRLISLGKQLYALKEVKKKYE